MLGTSFLVITNFVYVIFATILFILGKLILNRSFTTAALFCFLLGALYFDLSLLNVFYISVLGTIMFIENIFPRAAVADTSQENLRKSTYILLKRTAGPLLTWAVVYAGGMGWSLSWGLTPAPFWLQGLVTVIVLDFKQYWLHRGQHAYSLWWRFHRVHHFSEHINTLAHGRTHLLEHIFVQALSTELVIDLLGVNRQVALYAYSFFGILIPAFWAHANIDFPKKHMSVWSYVFSTPNSHALHHTKAFDRFNYGEIFVLWDLLFRTFRCPIAYRDEIKHFGVKDHASGQQSILAEQFFLGK